jgi:type I restriction enzyme S subunit
LNLHIYCSSLDSLIEAQNKKVSALKQHKKGLMQQLFPAEGEREPKRRFKAFSGEWEKKEVQLVQPIVPLADTVKLGL